jgi:hypothetical protein
MEEGTLDLDEPTGPPGVTVRHLLAHAGGLRVRHRGLLLPERKRIYSNTGFDALAEHLAHNAGMAAADYVQLAVFEPLKMFHTDLRGGSLAHGAWSTGADLARFAQELLAPTLIHPDTLALATSVAYPGFVGILPGIGPQKPERLGPGLRDPRLQDPALDRTGQLTRHLRPLRRRRHVPVGRPTDRAQPAGAHRPQLRPVGTRCLAAARRCRGRRARRPVTRSPHHPITR